ncbi:MAG: rhomboid family intramembrane serine protease [Anaerolineae bacterium]|nr:rhomboid family intramembrane serine protease [Anaerolineae bacterium]
MCGLIFVILFILLVLFLSSLVYPLPVNDSGLMRYRTVPWSTMFLIMVNAVIFVLWTAPDMYQVSEGGTEVELSPAYLNKIYYYGYSEYAVINGAGVGAFSTFSSTFMHANFWHLFGNMIYLWTFGRRVEDACGSWRFLVFYLLAGMVASMGSVLFRPGVDFIPSIGSSGAISGVMGAYLLLFWNAKIDCLWGAASVLRFPVALVKAIPHKHDDDYKIWRWTVTVPAWVVLIWFVFQNFIPSLEAIQNKGCACGVNYLAHFCGVVSALTVFLFVRKDLLIRYVYGRHL